MKKVIAVLLTLTLAFAFCSTAFAYDVPDSVMQTVSRFCTAGSDPLPEATAKQAISLLQGGSNKYDKPVIQYCLDQLKTEGKISEERYNLFVSVLNSNPDTTNPAFTMPATTAPGGDTTSGSGSGSGDGTTSGSGSLLPDFTLPNLPDITLPDINFDEIVSASDLIQKLKDAGIPASALQTVVDALHSAGVIDDTMYNDATNLINANEPTSESSNEGGIGGFLSGIVDTISGLFGGGTGDAGTGDGSSDEFGGSQATGDTALISVVAVAAVAGAALLLTKKKEDK